MYAKEGVCCNRRSDLESEYLECVWLEIKPVKSKPFLVSNIYSLLTQIFNTYLLTRYIAISSAKSLTLDLPGQVGHLYR